MLEGIWFLFRQLGKKGGSWAGILLCFGCVLRIENRDHVVCLQLLENPQSKIHVFHKWRKHLTKRQSSEGTKIQTTTSRRVDIMMCAGGFVVVVGFPCFGFSPNCGWYCSWLLSLFCCFLRYCSSVLAMMHLRLLFLSSTAYIVEIPSSCFYCDFA